MTTFTINYNEIYVENGRFSTNEINKFSAGDEIIVIPPANSKRKGITYIVKNCGQSFTKDVMPAVDSKYQQYVYIKTAIAETAPAAQAVQVVEKKPTTAKFFGGKALTGSAKQKAWGEEIRSEKLTQMSAEQATLVCSTVSVTGSAKFWIDARNASAIQIAEFIQRLVDAVKVANEKAKLGEIDQVQIDRIKKAQAGDLNAL